MTKLIKRINAVSDVFLITGRLESERDKTVASLNAAGVKYVSLLMNSTGNNSPLMQVRSKRYNATRVMTRKSVSMAIDDDPKARQMYKSLGITVVAAP